MCLLEEAYDGRPHGLEQAKLSFPLENEAAPNGCWQCAQWPSERNFKSIQKVIVTMQIDDSLMWLIVLFSKFTRGTQLLNISEY